VHYRDLKVVEHELAEAREGRFRIEPLPFHLAGIPSYLLLAELALSQVMRGELPRPEYPEALRRSAPARWWDRAALNLAYARDHHAPAGRAAACLGLLSVGTCQAAHAVLAARGEWVTNEKSLLDRAGLREVDRLIATARPSPVVLAEIAQQVLALCEAAVSSPAASRSAPNAPG
jgi:hypothetical protein